MAVKPVGQNLGGVLETPLRAEQGKRVKARGVLMQRKKRKAGALCCN